MKINKPKIFSYPLAINGLLNLFVVSCSYPVPDFNSLS